VDGAPAWTERLETERPRGRSASSRSARVDGAPIHLESLAIQKSTRRHLTLTATTAIPITVDALHGDRSIKH